MKFVDFVAIEVRAGDGGNGAVHFRREKFRPRMGPDGGDGGRGGSVFVVADAEITSLAALGSRRRFLAEHGQSGSGNRKTGRSGKDLILNVPVGTMVCRTDGSVLADLLRDGELVCVARGGAPGRGNAAFKSARLQTPRVAEPGQPGETARILLDWRIPNDVALVGFPASGKSSLLSSLTGVSVRIGSVGYSTRHPQWGYFETKDYRRIKVLDLPPVIATIPHKLNGGRSARTHLKHLCRSKAIVFVVSLFAADGEVRDHFLVQEEIDRLQRIVYQTFPELQALPSLVVMTGADLLSLPEADWSPHLSQSPGSFLVSNITGAGIAEVRNFIARVLVNSSMP